MKAGIVGSGKIVKECLRAIDGAAGVQAAAICVREGSRSKGEELAEKHGIPLVCTDYEEFLKLDSLDIIYIGIINSMHYEYAKKALEHGKNVILEKPMTTSAAEMAQLAGIAKEKGVFLFEAITTLHYPTFAFIKEQISNIGDIKMVQCNFSQYSTRYDDYLAGVVQPVFDPKLYGGALYDINVYNLHFVTALFGRPEKISYHYNSGYNGVDTSGTLILEYPGMVASCTAAKDSYSPCFGVIQGTKGYVQVDGSVSLCTLARSVTDQGELTFACPEAASRMCFEWEAFADMYARKDLEECYKLLEHSVMVMELLEAARENAGLRLG